MVVTPVAINEVVVFEMLDTPVAKVLSVEDCQYKTEPVFPDKESNVFAVEVQTAALPETVPPTEAGVIVKGPAEIGGVTEHPVTPLPTVTVYPPEAPRVGVKV